MNKIERVKKEEEKQLQQHADRLTYLFNYEIGQPVNIRVFAGRIEHICQDLTSVDLAYIEEEFLLYRISSNSYGLDKQEMALRILY